MASKCVKKITHTHNRQTNTIKINKYFNIQDILKNGRTDALTNGWTQYYCRHNINLVISSINIF